MPLITCLLLPGFTPRRPIGINGSTFAQASSANQYSFAIHSPPFNREWLILGFGVVAPRSGDQGTDERGEKLFAPFACIVNELEEPEIDRQLLLGNAPMGS